VKGINNASSVRNDAKVAASPAKYASLKLSNNSLMAAFLSLQVNRNCSYFGDTPFFDLLKFI